jgi:uncharacterized protein (DUF2236 family)
MPYLHCPRRLTQRLKRSVSCGLDRAAELRGWRSQFPRTPIPVRDYLDRLMTLDYLPRPFGTALGPVNQFLTTGFLPPPFREQMQLRMMRDRLKKPGLTVTPRSVRKIKTFLYRTDHGASLR